MGLYWSVSYEPTPENNDKTFSSLYAEQVNTIHIKRLNRNDILLNKEAGNWRIVKPIQANANPTRIKLILGLLSTRSHNQFKPDPSLSLQQFDLEPAKISLRLNDKVFNFGDIDALNHYRYIQHNDVIHLIEDTIAPLLNAGAASFIDNRLFSENSHITKLNLPAITDQEISSSVITLSLENGHWQSTDTTLSADVMTTLVDSWQHAYALQVLPLSKDELKTPFGQILTVDFDDQTTTKFFVQTDIKSLYLLDHTKKLKYQFPLANTRQLFPNQDIEN